MLIPIGGASPESPRVRELSHELRKTIEEFQRRYPMTPAEIRQALWHASGTWQGMLVGNRLARTALFWLVVIGLPVVMASLIRSCG